MLSDDHSGVDLRYSENDQQQAGMPTARNTKSALSLARGSAGKVFDMAAGSVSDKLVVLGLIFCAKLISRMLDVDHMNIQRP